MRQSADDRIRTSVKLVKRAVAKNDQAAYDFLTDTIEREQLYLRMTTDSGEPINNMRDLHSELLKLAEACGTAEK